MNFVKLLSIILLTLLLNGCQQKKTTGIMQSKEQHNGIEKIDPFVEGNKNIVRQEEEEIDLFIKRYQWTMVNSGSGLRIQILDEGRGSKFQVGDTVSLNYQLFLLDGSPVYSSEIDGKKEFIIGKTQEMSGLHEAVQYLSKGGKARLVLPAHLAYGVAGDGSKIKGRKSLAMTISIDN